MMNMEKFLKPYIFESIEHQKELPIKVFMASIGSSSLHWHNDYEIMLVLKGKLIVYLEAEFFNLKAGDIVLFNSKSIHGIKRNADDNICLFVQVYPALLDSMYNRNRRYNFYLNSANSNIHIKKDYYIFKNILANIGITHFSDKESRVYKLKSYIYKLFADLFDYTIYDIQQYADNVNTYENPELFIKIITYIENNYENSTLIDDICKHVGMSQPTLYRFLKNSTGFTIHDIVRALKTEKAKVMLSSTDKSISYISQVCGYNNEMTFYRAFKRETGLTPNEYRLSGSISKINMDVQGYMSFNRIEALELLYQYI